MQMAFNFYMKSTNILVVDTTLMEMLLSKVTVWVLYTKTNMIYWVEK